MEEQSNQIDVDLIFKKLGCGKFQIVLFAAMMVALYLHCCTGNLYAFTARDTQYRCFIEECEEFDVSQYHAPWLNISIPHTENEPSKCTKKVSLGDGGCTWGSFSNRTSDRCDRWVYGEGDSIVKTYRIPCQESKRSLVGTVNGLGKLAGLLVCGVMSDMFGRKTVMIGGMCLTGAIGMVQSLSTSYWLFVFLEFLGAFTASGVYTASFVIAVELMVPKRRVLGMCIINAVSGISCAMMGVYSWSLQDWRHLLWIVHGPTVPLFLYFWFFPESVRWLIARGRKEEADAIIKRAAKMNNVPLSHVILYKFEDIALKTPTCVENKNNILPFGAILKSRKLMLRFFICAFICLVSDFVFVGIMLNAVEVNNDGNSHLKYILVCAMELPAIFFKLLLLNALGRKVTLCGSLFCVGIFCTLFVLVPSQSRLVSTSLYMLAKLAITVSSGSLYMYLAELFPTGWRQSIMGSCSTVGRVGVVLANQIPMLGKTYPWAPMSLFGASAIVSTLFVTMLPETVNVNLPNTIEEAEDMKRTKGIKREC